MNARMLRALVRMDRSSRTHGSAIAKMFEICRLTRERCRLMAGCLKESSALSVMRPASDITLRAILEHSPLFTRTVAEGVAELVSRAAVEAAAGVGGAAEDEIQFPLARPRSLALSRRPKVF